MEQLTIQSLGFLKGFQEDIKVMIIIIIIIIAIVIVIIIVILACPDARCESRANLRVLPYYYRILYHMILITHTYIWHIWHMSQVAIWSWFCTFSQLVNTLPQSRFWVQKRWTSSTATSSRRRPAVGSLPWAPGATPQIVISSNT